MRANSGHMNNPKPFKKTSLSKLFGALYLFIELSNLIEKVRFVSAYWGGQFFRIPHVPVYLASMCFSFYSMKGETNKGNSDWFFRSSTAKESK